MDTPKWRIVGASVQGTSHQSKDVPCQDAHVYQVLPGSELLATVADGAGSGERSAEGAQTVVQQAIASLTVALGKQRPGDEAAWQNVIAEAFRQARESLDGLAGEDVPLRSFATTLTCAVATDDFLVVGQVGDSVVVAEDMSGSMFLPLQPQKGEYANETFFLTMPDALDRIEVKVISQPVKSLALISDGLLRLAVSLPDYEPSPRFFRPLWDFATQAEDETQAQEQLTAFLASERVCARTDDDKTLVLAVRLGG